MSAGRRVAAGFYRCLVTAREVFERMHIVMLGLELALLAEAVNEICRYFIGQRNEASAAHEAMPIHSLFDAALFVVLAIWLLADILIRVRGLFRGYNFGAPRFQLSQRRQAKRVLARIRTLCGEALSGYPLASSALAEPTAKLIAEASAQAFSLGTFGAVDEEWADPEANYVASWLERMPASAWFLNAPHASRGTSRESTKYCSVIFPIMADSSEMVGKGHLNTVLAHVDRRAAQFYRNDEPGAFGERLRLLIYTQVVLTEDQDHKPDPTLLVYCALQHLAFLIERFFPGRLRDSQGAPLELIAETSSSAGRALLSELGFEHIRVAKPSGLHRLEGWLLQWFITPFVQRSPAGFPLYQLCFEDAHSRAALAQVLQMFSGASAALPSANQEPAETADRTDGVEPALG